MFTTFNQYNFYQICDELADMDSDFKLILNLYGYPPFWSRPNTFESLVHIILEQQVSLASALATLNKLREKIGIITPENLLKLSDDALRACYFSRQKTAYVRHLAERIVSGELSLLSLELMDEHEIRHNLKLVKGVGDWTVDIYLIFILHHFDVFPLGDLAVVSAVKKLKSLKKDCSKDYILKISTTWKPYCTIAVMLLWHYYLENRKPANRVTMSV